MYAVAIITAARVDTTFMRAAATSEPIMKIQKKKYEEKMSAPVSCRTKLIGCLKSFACVKVMVVRSPLTWMSGASIADAEGWTVGAVHPPGGPARPA